MALGQSFSFGVFLITITSFFHLDAPKYLESKNFLNNSSNLQCISQSKCTNLGILEMIPPLGYNFSLYIYTDVYVIRPLKIRQK